MRAQRREKLEDACFCVQLRALAGVKVHVSNVTSTAYQPGRLKWPIMGQNRQPSVGL